MSLAGVLARPLTSRPSVILPLVPARPSTPVLLAAAALLAFDALAGCGPRAAESPCGGVLPVDANPASHLRAVWRVAGAQPEAIGNRLLARDSASAAVELDPATGKPLRVVSPSPTFSWMPDASRDDLWIKVDASPDVIAIDPVTLAERWRIPCDHDGIRCDVQGARAGSVAVFGGVTEYRNPNASMGVFAANTYGGKELWRTAAFPGDSMEKKLAADTEHAFFLAQTMLRAYRTSTGELLWTRAVENRFPMPMRARPIAAERGLVAFWESGTGRIRVLDGDTGEERATIPWPHMAGDLEISGGVLYASSFWDGDGMEVAAFEAESGDEQWHARTKDRWALPPLAIARDTLFVLRAETSNLALNHQASEIVALDRQHGNEVLVHPVGRVEQLAILPEAQGGMLLAFQAPTGEIIGMRRTAEAPVPVEITVTGKLTVQNLAPESHEPVALSGLRIEVGNTVVRADEHGAFSAHTSALGALRVRLLDVPPRADRSAAPLHSEPVLFYVDPKGPQALETTLVIEPVAPWPPD